MSEADRFYIFYSRQIQLQRFSKTLQYVSGGNPGLARRSLMCKDVALHIVIDWIAKDFS